MRRRCTKNPSYFYEGHLIILLNTNYCDRLLCSGKGVTLASSLLGHLDVRLGDTTLCNKLAQFGRSLVRGYASSGAKVSGKLEVLKNL